VKLVVIVVEEAEIRQEGHVVHDRRGIRVFWNVEKDEILAGADVGVFSIGNACDRLSMIPMNIGRSYLCAAGSQSFAHKLPDIGVLQLVYVDCPAHFQDILHVVVD